MRAHEFTIETISYSTHRDYTLNYLNDVFNNKVNQLPMVMYNKYREFTMETLREHLGTVFRRELQGEISKALEFISNNAEGMKGDNQITVAFEPLKNGGHAKYSHIALNDNYLNKSMDIAWELIKAQIFDNYLYTEDDDYQLWVNADEWVSHMKEHPFHADLDNTMTKMVSTFIHELVHIRQHAPQPPHKTEYRSYTMKKPDFNKAIWRIHDGVSTDLDDLAHASSPQEIPARAHDTVVDYITDITYTNPLKLKPNKNDIHELESLILAIDPRDILDKTYQKFNKPNPVVDFKKPNSKEYKIYTRYMKIIYQEIMAYRQYLTNRLNYLKQELAKQQDYY